MTVTITAEGIVAICTVLALLAGAFLWVVKATVSSELRKLNGRYIYSKGSEMTGHEIEQRIIAAEAGPCAYYLACVQPDRKV